MARVKRAVNAHKKRRKALKLAKGYFGAKSKQYRAASEQVRRSLRYAYIGRKLSILLYQQIRFIGQTCMRRMWDTLPPLHMDIP